jgi:hypothetical protein
MRKGAKYSGDDSSEFWDRVNALESPEWDALYSLGVVLQNLEEYVLGQLYQDERDKKELDEQAPDEPAKSEVHQGEVNQ